MDFLNLHAALPRRLGGAHHIHQQGALHVITKPRRCRSLRYDRPPGRDAFNYGFRRFFLAGGALAIDQDIAADPE